MARSSNPARSSRTRSLFERRSAVVPRIERLRVALYSHDALGLGHTRRNLAIAHATATACEADILLLTSAPQAVLDHRPPGCDLVALPALIKDSDGEYTARHLSLQRDDVLAVRSSILEAALRSFAPDILIVDKHPRGFAGELEPALNALRALSPPHAPGTHVVLGVRDVLDDAATAAAEWEASGSAAALQQWYDEIWVYGDADVHDPLAGLALPDRLRDRVVHTGYLATGRGSHASARPTPTTEPYVVAMVGGGADGAELASAFAAAELPEGHRGVLVTGPQMPAEHRRRIERLAATRPELDVYRYVEDAEALLARAAAVVSMGGYNTVCEAMAHGRPLLVVPRVRPRAEQLVRAEALARAGMLDVLHPDRLVPAALADWMRGAVGPAPDRTPSSHRTHDPHRTPGPDRALDRQVDLAGLTRVGELVQSIATTRKASHVA